MRDSRVQRTRPTILLRPSKCIRRSSDERRKRVQCTVGKQAYGSKSRCVRLGNEAEPLGNHSAYREHRQRDARTGITQRSDTCTSDVRLRRGAEHGPEDQIVETAATGSLLGLFGRMYGTSHDEAGRRDAADTWRGEGIAAQMYAVGPRSERHVEALIHEHARAGSSYGEHCRRDQLGQHSSFPVALADLHQVNACSRRCTNAIDQRTIALQR
jgi:hypothetical protein